MDDDIELLCNNPCMNRLKAEISTFYLSKSVMAQGNLLADLSEGSEVWPGFICSARFMDTAGAPAVFCALGVVVFSTWITAFLGSTAALPNGSSERDSKSLNRERHQKHWMIFLASLLKANKVNEHVWECLVCQYTFSVCIFMSCGFKSFASCPAITPWSKLCIFMKCVNVSLLSLQNNYPCT